MRLRITALLLTFAGAANCLRMAAKRRPHNTKSRIVRVTGGKASVLYSDGARQWTIDGSRLKHFELDDLRKRDFDKLGVLVHAHGACARYKGRTAQVVRLVNAEFAKLH